MPRSDYGRGVDIERVERWLNELEASRPWRYRLLVVGLGLLLFSACGFLALVLHP